jgi:hypothetical protein
MRSRIVHTAAAVLLASTGLVAGGQSAGLKGTTTSQQGAVCLPGVAVTVLDPQGRQTAATASGGDGQFSLAQIPPGRYTVVAALKGFREARRAVEVQPNAIAEVNLNLEVVASETVSVVVKAADAALGFASSSASREVVAAQVSEQLPVGGDSIQAALRLISSVTEQTGGVRIKGGRADQASLQIGRVIVNDPTGGAGAFRLPVDAADSIEVLPNPYGAEFGGFSSGLTIVHPRTGPDAWRFRMNGFVPSFITKRNNPVYPVAIEELNPRVVVGGPLGTSGLSLLVSAQGGYHSEQVWSRPLSERRDTTGASFFTRLDGRAGTRHAFSAMVGFFPNTATRWDLDTFTPPAATIDVRQQAITASFTDSIQLPASSTLESTVAVGYHSSLLNGQGPATMVVTPDEVLGNFYNGEDRRATTVQLSEVFSTVRRGPFGTHLFKAGLDALQTGYEETSTNRPIEVRRGDGTLAELLTFDPISRQRASTNDVAAFVQDWWQLNSRVLVEAGARLEYNGTLGATSVAPRAAATLALKADGSSALRVGIGVFPDRVPPAVQAFGRFGSQTEARYAADGVTLLAPPVVFVHALGPDLRTPRSLTWSVEYDQRFTPRLSVRMNYLDRTGSNELVVQPIRSDATGVLLLSTTGRSVYRDAEVAVRYVHDNVIDLAASYTRSQSRANLNGYGEFYGLKHNPFVRSDEYAPTDVHAPNRFLLWTTVSAVRNWLFGVVTSVRNGFPYSAVNEYLDFVGPRNEGRAFPTFVSLDVSVEWHIKVGKLRPWVGFTVYNALDSPLPADVQANLGSEAFGSFYNSAPRQFRLSLRFTR